MRTLAYNCESLPLIPVSDIILNDELAGIYGYVRDLTIEVEVYLTVTF